MSPLVPIETVVEAMDARWRGFGNVSSSKLREVWAEIVRVFNVQIETPSERWPVIAAELGAGKTTLAKIYCTLLPRVEHPGVLIVAQLIDQAEEYATNINAWAGAPVAFAFHSRLNAAARKPLGQNLRGLASLPVLVVCHKAYEMGLDHSPMDEDHPKFQRLLDFNDGTSRGRQRQLVIVDEALDQVHEARIDRAELELALRFLQRNRQIEKAHAQAIDVLDAVQRTLRSADEKRHRAVPVEELLRGTLFTTPDEASVALAALWSAARAANNLKTTQKSNDADERKKRVSQERAVLGDVIVAVRRHLADYRWVAGEKTRTAMSGPRLLLMPRGTNGVMLDATGRLNNVYINRPDQFEIIPLPQVRDYRTVTVYVANTTQTGKVFKNQQDGAERAERVLQDVLTHYGDRAAERRVLIVYAANSEAFYKESPHKARFARCETAHWNAVAGKNEWHDFDTVVIATLNYALETTDLNTHMALKGAEFDDEALNAENDEVSIVRETRIAAEVTQALGRIRLRHMTNEHGQCESCDVFLRFPNGGMRANPARLLDNVKRALPGAVFVPWTEANTPLRRPGRAAVARKPVIEALVAYATTMTPGSSEPIPEVRRKIGALAHGTWFRVQGNVGPQLAAIGAKIEPAHGRCVARLVKVA